MFHGKGHWGIHRGVLPVIIGLFLLGCTEISGSVSAPLSQWDDSLGCPMSHRQNFFNPYYHWAGSEDPVPDEEELIQYLSLHGEGLTSFQKNKLLEIHRHLLSALGQMPRVEERMQYLAALDLGDSEGDLKWFSTAWWDLYGDSPEGAHCGSPQPPPLESDGHFYRLDGHPRAWWGAMKAFATVYQSCEALHSPPLTEDTPAVEGLRYWGTHATGRARLYAIDNLHRLVRSQPYLRDWSAASQQCVHVPSQPLIYDFGGKPYVDPNLPHELNFFKNAGTGSPALGLDCSAFVFSSLASVGLKVRSSLPLKANHVYGVSAAMIYAPERNGLDCLSPIPFHQLRVLEPGDIVASRDHVFMIDHVGEDPFGVGHLSESQCHISHMDYRRFDFDIVQSSASKNFLGVHRMRGADYLATDSTMRQGLEDYALSLCLARFGKRRPPARTQVSVVRASGSPACVDRPVTLTHQSCVKGCFDRTDIFDKYYGPSVEKL